MKSNNIISHTLRAVFILSLTVAFTSTQVHAKNDKKNDTVEEVVVTDPIEEVVVTEPVEEIAETDPVEEVKVTGKPDKEDKETGNSGNSGNSGSSDNQLGSIGETTYYHTIDGGDWDINGTVEIVGDVIVVIDGDGDWNIGNNSVTIAEGGSLTVYVGGNITANGQGSVNDTGTPTQLTVIGLHPEITGEEASDYNLTLSGNGNLKGAVYAPNANYRINGKGNGDHAICGSVIARNVTVNGNASFHYDIALRTSDFDFGDYKLSKYKVLSNGEIAPSDSARAVVGTNTYDRLFSSIFDEE